MFWIDPSRQTFGFVSGRPGAEAGPDLHDWRVPFMTESSTPLQGRLCLSTFLFLMALSFGWQ